MKKWALLLITALSLTGCGIQSIPQAKNATDASEAEIMNQYNRRADLIPNLVNTVKGFAKQEKEVLTQVTEARAKATSVQVNASDAQSVKNFQAAQGELSSALARLMVVVEKYPQLKSDANFRDLQAQIEGTENRIAIARQRHIQNIQAFNNLITVPPTNFTNMLFYHHDKMAQWTAENPDQVKQVPKVEF